MESLLTPRELESRAALLLVLEEWTRALRAVRTSVEFSLVVDRMLHALESYRSQLADAVAGAGSLGEVSSAMERASARLSKLAAGSVRPGKK